nr:FecR domain-containing protein [uncultured Cohaesibacter sp.]
MHRIAFILVLFFLFPSEAFTQTTASWTVQKITGLAYIAEKGVPAIKVRQGSILAPGQTLSTSNRTRLLLTRDKERIQVGPGTIMAIPPEKYIQPGKTLILQQSGQLQLSVNKKDVQHFAVRTPYLTAVVKGTTFTVDVEKNRSNVSVRNGRVEVTDGATGNTTEITRGQTASVTQNATGKTQMSVTAAGPKPAVRTIRSKITKPNFYATVKIKGKKVALRPGTKLETTSIEEVREEVTTATSGNARANTTSSNNSYASRDVSIDKGSDNKSSRSSESNSSSSSNNSSASTTGPGNSNGAGNSENSNASDTATGSSSSSSSSNTSTSTTSPGNSHGAGNSQNSNASDTATGSNTSSSSSDTTSSTTSPGNSNGAGNSENSNASDTATGTSSSSSSSNTSTSTTSPGNSNGAGNSENSNASDTATGTSSSSSSSNTSTSTTSPGNSNGAGNSENSHASDTALGNGK